jgi:hypothetical protein
VLVVKALINGDPVSVPFDHVVEATAPRYPARRDSEVIDLTTITDGGPGFTTAACETIRDRVNHYFGPSGEGNRIGHASIFALAPISLLIFLGRQLTNKVPTNLFQRHRDTERWTWKRGGKAARYSVKRLRRGSGRSKVALVVALSGSIQIRDLPQAIRRSATIYSISLEGQAPRPTFLRTREDLESFRAAYQEALGRIGQNHGLLQSIDIFPAVPAPVAILCGRELLPKVHPSLRVWDYDKTKDGFEFILEV